MTQVYITHKTIEFLNGIISGDTKLSPYRTKRELVNFFNDFEFDDGFQHDLSSRSCLIASNLKHFNRTESMAQIIESAFDFFDSSDFEPEKAVREFNQILFRDGYILEKRHRRIPTNIHQSLDQYFYFKIISNKNVFIETVLLESLDSGLVKEQIDKVKDKYEKADYSGSIASCYTLIEQLLKLILKEKKIDFKETCGDIRTLYNILKEHLHLDASKSNIDVKLKPILTGLQQIISGLFELANKASDRHARVFDPSAHHAKLAVNATLSLTEFLIATNSYQLRIDKNNL